MAVPFTLK